MSEHEKAQTEKRFTLNQMFKKYKALHSQNFEQVLITQVLDDLYRIKRDRLIPAKEFR